MSELIVSRYSKTDPITGMPSGDHLRVGKHDLCAFSDIVNAEHERAKAECPRNPAFNMRPMFYTGSPFGAEILQLARQVRGAS